jgi:endonuclease III
LAGFAERIDRLAAFYGPLPAPPADPFGFYVWEVLGTRTTAGRRDAAMAALRRAPALTPDSLHKLARGRLEAIVRLAGPLAGERIAALEAGAAVFRRQPRFADRLRGPLRVAWLAARDLPHLGHAGALRLLMFTAASPIVPVDAGVARVVTRLGLVPPRDNVRRLTREVRRRLDAELSAELSARRRAVLYLHHHAEHTCIEASPHCAVCPVAIACAFGRQVSAFGDIADAARDL